MDKYRQFIDMLIQELPDFNDIDNIISVYLSGSVSRGDYIVGASDIDIYVICNKEDSNLSHSFESHVQNIASSFLSEIMNWYPDVVSIAFTTYEDIKNGSSFLGKGADYYSFNDSGKLIYGMEIRDKIIKTDEEQNKKIAEQVLKQLKEIVNQDIPKGSITRYDIRGIFGLVFTAVHSALVIKGVYLRGKEQLVKELLKYDKVTGEKMERVYSDWLAFENSNLTENEKINLLGLVKEVVIDL